MISGPRPFFLIAFSPSDDLTIVQTILHEKDSECAIAWLIQRYGARYGDMLAYVQPHATWPYQRPGAIWRFLIGLACPSPTNCECARKYQPDQSNNLFLSIAPDRISAEVRDDETGACT